MVYGVPTKVVTPPLPDTPPPPVPLPPFAEPPLPFSPPVLDPLSALPRLVQATKNEVAKARPAMGRKSLIEGGKVMGGPFVGADGIPHSTVAVPLSV
jgi:hypothetical protein